MSLVNAQFKLITDQQLYSELAKPGMTGKLEDDARLCFDPPSTPFPSRPLSPLPLPLDAVIDVFCKWAGPCEAMQTIFKKLLNEHVRFGLVRCPWDFPCD